MEENSFMYVVAMLLKFCSPSVVKILRYSHYSGVKTLKLYQRVIGWCMVSDKPPTTFKVKVYLHPLTGEYCRARMLAQTKTRPCFGGRCRRSTIEVQP